MGDFMRKYHAVRVATVAVVASALVASWLTPPAQAAESACTVRMIGRLCLWDGRNYSSTFSTTTGPRAGSGCSEGWSFRSAMNMTKKTFRFYSGTSCTGRSYTLEGDDGPIAKSGDFGFMARSVIAS